MSATTTLKTVLQTGLLSVRPAASAVAAGSLYAATDDAHIYQSDGSTWSVWGALGSGGASMPDPSGQPDGEVLQTSSGAAVWGADPGGASGAPGADGWIDDTAETWTYASATTFTVAGDQTSKYRVGGRIKLTQTTVKYFVIVASTYSSGSNLTTVTVTGGSDYTLANAAISANYHSYQPSPDGYPSQFNYTPTYQGFSTLPVITATFAVDGHACRVWLALTNTGTSNGSPFTITLPVPLSGYMPLQPLLAINSGSWQTSPGMVQKSSPTAVIIYKTWHQDNFDGAGAACGFAGTFVYPI